MTSPDVRTGEQASHLSRRTRALVLGACALAGGGLTAAAARYYEWSFSNSPDPAASWGAVGAIGAFGVAALWSRKRRGGSEATVAADTHSAGDAEELTALIPFTRPEANGEEPTTVFSPVPVSTLHDEPPTERFAAVATGHQSQPRQPLQVPMELAQHLLFDIDGSNTAPGRHAA